jgi:predicted GNAT superfamily acetyltransferase
VSDVTIRPFASIEDYRACVALQEETWGEGFSERVSPAILKVAQILGGVSSGAFAEDGRLVGFVFGLTGQRNGEVVHWSDMLAVRAELRDTGLGRRLKAYQREEVLSRGVEKMFWTFDPLRSRNAHLNVTRLGAVVREYVPDMYGDTDSPLHRGIGTDRFVALWLLSSARVERRVTEFLSGSGGVRINVDPDVPFALSADVTGRWPRPGEPDLTLDNAAMRVAIPSDVGALMQEDPQLAVAWRRATRAAFAHYIARGYEVQEFERGGAVSAYLLAKIVEDES